MPFTHVILTEDVNRDAIIAILSKYFESFSITPQVGYWQGKAENSLAITLIDVAYADVRRAGEEIRKANSQEAVLITSTPIKRTLLLA